jgi:hypothetical protein
LVEAYARESDLIVRFEQAENDTFAFQLYYRLLESSPRPDATTQTPEVLGLELWVSVQTDLLDAAPQLSVTVCAPTTGEGWQKLAPEAIGGNSADGILPLVNHSTEYSGVWLIDAGDIVPTELPRLSSDSTLGEQSLRLPVLGGFMEKGVIRRARMRFHLVVGKPDQAQLQSMIHDFTISPLPLTA